MPPKSQIGLILGRPVSSTFPQFKLYFSPAIHASTLYRSIPLKRRRHTSRLPGAAISAARNLADKVEGFQAHQRNRAKSAPITAA